MKNLLLIAGIINLIVGVANVALYSNDSYNILFPIGLIFILGASVQSLHEKIDNLKK